MVRYFTVVIVAAIACGCGSTPPEQVADESPPLTGKQVYERVCSGCHEDGVDGAPRIGDRDAWKGRSRLWQAVLFEHANAGFLKMPARGGDATLNDAMVARAAEYMLSRTFPEINRD